RPAVYLYCLSLLCRLFSLRTLSTPSLFFFSLLTLRPPRSPLFPYTTLFRSVGRRSLRQRHRPVRRRSLRRHRRLLLCGLAKRGRSEEHTSELQSRFDLVCRLLLEKKKRKEL